MDRKTRTELLKLMDELQAELAQLDSIQATMMRLSRKITSLQKKKSSNIEEFVSNVEAGRTRGQILDATKQMQETQMSFNLQYLQLQSQMQHENRSYTAVSNIMKTKHDTVKNSISNIR